MGEYKSLGGCKNLGTGSGSWRGQLDMGVGQGPGMVQESGSERGHLDRGIDMARYKDQGGYKITGKYINSTSNPSHVSIITYLFNVYNIRLIIHLNSVFSLILAVILDF